MKYLVPILFCVLFLTGCTTDVHFPPHSTTRQYFKVPLALGLYYTTGTLERVQVYDNNNVSMTRTWRVHVGEALEKEAFSRLRPRVERLIHCENPYPGYGVNYVLTLGIEEFAWKNLRAETRVLAELRGPENVVLLNRSYYGAGSAQLQRIASKLVIPAQGLGETTREAMVAVMTKVIEDMDPYLIPPQQGATAESVPR